MYRIVGNDVAGKEFRDNEPPFDGNLTELYEKTMNFISRNLHKKTSGKIVQ